MDFTMSRVSLLKQCKQVELRSRLDSQLLPKQCGFYAILRKDVECRIRSNSNEFYLGFSLMMADSDSDSEETLDSVAFFTPTPLHDLEPLFWMLIWTLCSRSIKGPSLHPWQTEGSKIFESHGGKKDFILVPTDFLKSFRKEHRNYRKWTKRIKKLAKVLVEGHRDFQAELPRRLSPQAYADYATPQDVVYMFTLLSDTLDSIDVDVKFCKLGLSDGPDAGPAKRQRISD
jgi:hypothetical protein